MGIPWQWLVPTGGEDVAFWQSNNLRHHQQVALGMVGAIQRIAGAIFPVAIVEDVRRLSDSSSIHTFGGYVGGTANRTGVLEIHAPESESYSVSVLRIWSSDQTNTPLRQQIRILDPGVNDIAVITMGARELDDGWNAYHRTHNCRVFIGWHAAPSPPAGPCTAATTTDTHGINLTWGSNSEPSFLSFEPEGILIPRGKNLCVSNWHEPGSSNLCHLFGVMLRETKPATGPVGARAGF